jgi:hyperosmotically inducible periplasmic protein
MRNGIGGLAAVLALLIVVAGCQATTGKTAGDTVEDATITAAVKSRLVADRAANLTRIDVDTDHGTVYLNGTVETVEQKVRAEQLAWQARGVRNVVNKLQLQRR